MKKLLIIIISLLIYSCSNTEIYRVTITQGTVFTQEDLDKLEIGMTKDQVSFVMGQPSFENFFEKNVWNYIYKVTTGDEIDVEKKVKLIFDEKYGELLGAHIVGSEATEMIAELGMAKALEGTWDDLSMTVHAHPTLSEAIMEAAMDAQGHSIHQ